jgi:hypothetical protein
MAVNLRWSGLIALAEGVSMEQGRNDAKDGASPHPPTEGNDLPFGIETRDKDQIDSDVRDYQAGYEGERLKQIAENTKDDE